jgi:chemotaxis protein MotA
MSADGGLAKRSHEENWLPILELAIQEVFEIMLGCQVNPMAPSEHKANAEFTAMVGLAGALCGILTVCCDANTAHQIATHMLGDGASSEEQAADALGEMCNMITGNLLLEGGNLGQVLQPTAAMIVFGGTLGAVLIQYPLSVALSAFRRLAQVFVEPAQNAQSTIELLVKYANQARREGIISLDKELAAIPDPFLRRALMLAVDGTDPQELRNTMELELDNKEEQEEKIPQLFESAGGFSPTIGIIGAVLGLIQVMQHLDKIDEVGRGIAVAFVATLYGVGAANLILLPAAGKLKIRIRDEQIIREMMLEGVVSILEGMNPRVLEGKLLGFLTEAHKPSVVPEVSNA